MRGLRAVLDLVQDDTLQLQPRYAQIGAALT
jgi:hypothetical protein